MHINALAIPMQPCETLESSLSIPRSPVVIRAYSAESSYSLHLEQPALIEWRRLHATTQVPRPLRESSACKVPLAGNGSSVSAGGMNWVEFSVFADSRGFSSTPGGPDGFVLTISPVLAASLASFVSFRRFGADALASFERSWLVVSYAIDCHSGRWLRLIAFRVTSQ
jgi:hypothetical protein